MSMPPKLTILLCSALLAALASVSASGQVDTRSGSITAISPLVMPSAVAGSSVLYDQTTDASPPLGASAQQLFTATGALDTLAADDIVVAEGAGWLVSQVNFVVA